MAEGCLSPGDGGGGLFMWIVPQTMPSDDGGTIIVPQPNTSPPGYWQRFLGDTRVFNILAFGALSYPQSTDTSSAIQNALNAAHSSFPGAGPSSGGTVYVPPGRWTVQKTLYTHGNVNIEGAAAGNTGSLPSMILSHANGPAIALSSTEQRTPAAWGAEIRNLTIASYGSSSGVVGIDFSGVSYGKIESVNLGCDGTTRLPGSIGILLTDYVPGSSTFYNNLERINVGNYETGISFESAHNNVSLNALIGFSIGECKYGLNFSAPSGEMSAVVANGYIFQSFAPVLDPDIRVTQSSGGYIFLTAMGVFSEGYGAPTAYDLPLSRFTQGGLPGQTNALVTGWLQADAFKTRLDGAYQSGTGADPTNPIPPQTRHVPGPYALSFWAMIPSGKTLGPGPNTNQFVYYSHATHLPGISEFLPPGLTVICRPQGDGGIGIPFTMFVTPSLTDFGGLLELTYTVTVNVASPITLSSDLVFLLEANLATPRSD
jgi:hypothetical protein